jgi:ABC-type antimicrobial peptide transport system ATPase subunit
MTQWVIDTWVIATCDDASSNKCLDCECFLAIILENGIICLDTENKIMEEYYKYIKPRTFVSRWWDRMVRDKGQIVFFSNSLPGKHRGHLLHKLHFDSSDIKFIGVASKTKDRLLVSGDSDYSADICDYLSRELSIKVLCPGEFESV